VAAQAVREADKKESGTRGWIPGSFFGFGELVQRLLGVEQLIESVLNPVAAMIASNDSALPSANTASVAVSRASAGPNRLG
jgi:hypothetical protein